LPSDNAEKLIERLATYSTRELPDGDRQLIWHALQDALRRNQKHQEADWALSAETLERLADVCSQFEPKDSLWQLTRLFARWHHLFDHQPDIAYEERERRLRELRLEGLRRLYAEGGLSRVLQLAEAPGKVAAT
jgi:hypothetical protein